MRRALVIGALAAAGLFAWRSAAIEALFADREPAGIETLRVRRSALQESSVAIGALQAKTGAEVRVGSRLSGVVARLAVDVGDRVARGQELAALEDADARARSGVLRADLASAEAELAFASGDLERSEKLGDLLPEIDRDSRRRTLDVRRAAVERARAALAEAELELGWTVIRAPMAGTIASVSTYVGETVAASLAAPTFLTIVDLDRLEVRAFVDETDIGRVAVGQRAAVRIDAFPGRPLAGTVSAIYPKAQLVGNVVNYVVLLDLEPGSGLLLRPEMTTHVDFVLASRENALVIPRAALFVEGGRSFVRRREGKDWKERDVTLGLETPQRIEIVDGLAEGDEIVADRQSWKGSGERER